METTTISMTIETPEVIAISCKDFAAYGCTTCGNACEQTEIRQESIHGEAIAYRCNECSTEFVVLKEGVETSPLKPNGNELPRSPHPATKRKNETVG